MVGMRFQYGPRHLILGLTMHLRHYPGHILRETTKLDPVLYAAAPYAGCSSYYQDFAGTLQVRVHVTLVPRLRASPS